MEKENIVKVYGTNLPISTKVSIEICNYIRNKKLEKAKVMLQRVLDKKEAIPFKRYNMDIGHKPGRIAAGRYPHKASKVFLDLINSLEKNAENKGFNSELLKINFAVANKGPKQWHYGRKRRIKAKRTHIELRAIEFEEKKNEDKSKEKKEK